MHGFLIAIDLTNEESLHEAESLIMTLLAKGIEEQAVIMMVGTKLDLIEDQIEEILTQREIKLHRRES